MVIGQSFQKKTLFCHADGQVTQGTFESRELSLVERFQRTAKVSLLILGAAVLAIFIPFLHFILVPILLICAAVFGVTTWMDKSELLAGEYPCPQCRKTNTLARGFGDFPRTIRCEHCHFTVTLDLKPNQT